MLLLVYVDPTFNATIVPRRTMPTTTQTNAGIATENNYVSD